MALTDDIVAYLADHAWQSTEVANDDYQLELHPGTDRLVAGFTLWQRRPDGRLDLLASGYSDGERLLNADGRALVVPEEVERGIGALLSSRT